MSAISREGTSAWLANLGYPRLADAVMNEERFPPEQPEHIQNNSVHLCGSCQYTFPTCPTHDSDVIFGDGKGNDNICACNKYRPISAQPKQKKGKWIRWYEIKEDETGTEHIPHCRCSECNTEYDSHSSQFVSFCYVCGAAMKGEEE